MQKDAIHDVWRDHATKWSRVGSPLRPTEEDTHIMLMLSAPAFSHSKVSSNVIILGVTPELVQLPWPSHARLHAFDHSAEMIASVWRPHSRNPSSVQQACWQKIPLPDESIDLVIGDGCLTMLPCADDYRAVLAESARVLKLTGLLVLRCFIRPERTESLHDVFMAAHAGMIGSFHALKWRVAMAITPDEEFSVAVTEIHTAFERLFPDRDQLACYTGWPRAAIDTIDAYQGRNARYTFPTMSELKQLALPFVEVTDISQGNYELADRCPILCFKPINYKS
jgi:SAM-dependent methyltransferase